MIIFAIFTVIFFILRLVLSLVPSIPQLPNEILQNANYLINFIAGGFGVIMHIYTPVLAGAIVGMTIALLFFNQGYYILIWILKKLKILG